METKIETKKEKTNTVASVIYKGSYNILCELQTDKKAELKIDITNNKKVFNQLSIFNSQKPFAKITQKVKDDNNIGVFALLSDNSGKENFSKLLSIAKKVFEPKLVW